MNLESAVWVWTNFRDLSPPLILDMPAIDAVHL